MKFITKYIWPIVIVLVAIGIALYLLSGTSSQHTAEVVAELETTDNQESMDTKEQGEVFLLENGKKEGVITTESGLQYEILEAKSEGESPVLTSSVNVHYHGTTIDGGVFDSSVERGMPISFPLGAVIQGWQEGLQLMKVGEKFKFTIPSEIAYGDQSPSPAIPANSTLIFEVELLGIE